VISIIKQSIDRHKKNKVASSRRAVIRNLVNIRKKYCTCDGDPYTVVVHMFHALGWLYLLDF